MRLQTQYCYLLRKKKKFCIFIRKYSDKNIRQKSIIQKVDKPTKSFITAAKEWYEQKAFNVKADEFEKVLIDKIVINDIAEMFSGVKVYEVGKGTPTQSVKVRYTRPFTSKVRNSEERQPFYDRKHISSYQSFGIMTIGLDMVNG